MKRKVKRTRRGDPARGMVQIRYRSEGGQVWVRGSGEWSPAGDIPSINPEFDAEAIKDCIRFACTRALSMAGGGR